MAIDDAFFLEVLHQLPDLHGYSATELGVVEHDLALTFPKRYKEILDLAGKRLSALDILLPINSLVEMREEASGLLVEDGRDKYRLHPNDVVFAWDDIIAFYFF